MYSLNQAKIIGYITADPEIRELPSGVCVADLNIEIKSRVNWENSETQFRTTFLTVTVWRRLAELARDYVKKGNQLYLAGRLETDSWEDDEGNTKYKTKMIADDMILLSPKDGFLSPLSESLQISGGVNKVEVVGNMTKNPEIKTTQNGNKVSSFGVATTRVWRDSNGEKQEKTEFHNIVVWDSLAEEAAKYITKGRKVYVCGRVQTRSWENPEGKKRYTTEVIAEEIKSLGHSASTENATTSDTNTNNENTSVKNNETNIDNIPEINYESEIKPEDLPF